MKTWYYMENEKRQGPITEDALLSLLEEGVLGIDTMVWAKGLEEWVVASEVENLVPEVDVPPPLPGDKGDDDAHIQQNGKSLRKYEDVAESTRMWINGVSVTSAAIVIGILALLDDNEIINLPGRPAVLVTVATFLGMRWWVLRLCGIDASPKATPSGQSQADLKKIDWKPIGIAAGVFIIILISVYIWLGGFS